MSTITPLPTPVPQRNDPANFASRADTFLAALPTFATETNTVAGEVNTNATNAVNAANTATTKASEAATSATNSLNSANDSAASAVLAEDFAQKTGSPVIASEYSAKEHAIGTLTTTGGSAKAWATSATSPDGTSSKSSKSYAEDSAASAAASEASKVISVTKAGEASSSAASAASSAAMAAAAIASVGFQDVLFINNTNSPYTVTQATSGKLIACDTSSGNIIVNLPVISSLTLPFVVGVKKTTSDSNTVTVNLSGSDTFDDGSTSKSVITPAGFTLIPDVDTSPDVWASISFGGANAGSVGSSGLTMNTNKILGRNSSGSGAIEEISVATQAEAEAGTLTEIRGFTPQRISQAINSLGKSKILLSQRTSNTQLTASDFGKLIDITSGTFTQTFDASASLGSGWWCLYRNSGAGDITLDPNGSELIDGGASLLITTGQVRIIQCDGTALTTVLIHSPLLKAAGGEALKPGREYVASVGATNFIVPAMNVGEVITLTSEYSGSARMFVSDDGWTYRSDSSTSTGIYRFTGTGTKRPAVGEYSVIHTPPSASIATASIAAADVIVDANTHVLYGNAATLVYVKKSDGSLAESGQVIQSYNGGAFDPVSGKVGLFYSLNTPQAYAKIHTPSDNTYAGAASLAIGALLSSVTFLTPYLAIASGNVGGGSGIKAVSFNYAANTVTPGTAALTLYMDAVARINDTQFLAVAVPTVGGTVSARVGTVSGTTISFGATAVSTGQSGNAQGDVRFLLKLSDTKFIAVITDNGTNTTAHVYGVDISGTTVTFSARQTIVGFGASSGSYKGQGCVGNQAPFGRTNSVVIDENRALITSATGNAVVAKYAAGVLSVGAVSAIASSGLRTDVATGANIYAVGSANWSKLSFSDTTINTDYTVVSGGAISCVFYDGLTNREFRNPAGTWYSFASGGPIQLSNYAASTSMAVRLSGTTAYCYRNITV